MSRHIYLLFRCENPLHIFYGTIFVCFSTALYQENIKEAMAAVASSQNLTVNCIVCRERPVDLLLMECNHGVTCLSCWEQWKRFCPYCRTEISEQPKYIILPTWNGHPDFTIEHKKELSWSRENSCKFTFELC